MNRKGLDVYGMVIVSRNLERTNENDGLKMTALEQSISSSQKKKNFNTIQMFFQEVMLNIYGPSTYTTELFLAPKHGGAIG